MPSATELVELGVAPELAKEMAAQFTVNVGNARRLQELGLPGGPASEIVTQLAGTPDVRRLIERGFPPVVAKEIAAQIAE